MRYTKTMTSDGVDPRALERVGAVLNEKWTLEHLIGSGGMGAVYAAKHRNGARAAVKVLHPELARIAEVRERFLREGYAANRVEHRGAVQVLDDDVVKSGPDEGSAYLVMELLEGESLQERVLRGPKLTERELLEVMDAVLDVLAAAHAHGVIHRDLKPENIFLAPDPEREGVRVKVLDFGLARISEARGVTNAGIAVGTPSFMSPEQAAGRSAEIDGRTDIFALGATMFRIVTGRRIHEAENMVQLVTLMANVPAPRLRSIEPDVSESFAHVIDRALAFDREDRYPDAEAMRADVRAALDMCVRTSAASFVVIPFSARNVRVGSFSSLADIPPQTTDAKDAKDAKDTNDDEEAAARDEGSGDDAKVQRAARRKTYVDIEEESAIQAPVRSLARSATLPWLIVLLLLGVGAWKLLPSIQEELVRRASLWASSAPPSLAPSTSASATTTSATEEQDASSAPGTDTDASVEDIDDAGALETDSISAEPVTGDAAAPPASSVAVLPSARPPARPQHPTSPHAAGKPPAKRPPAPPPTRKPAPTPTRKH